MKKLKLENMDLDEKILLAVQLIESIAGDFPYERNKARLYKLAEDLERATR